MFYCEQCRVKKNWPLPVIYPYHTMALGECDSCHREKMIYSIPAIYLTPEAEQTAAQRSQEEILQEAFKQKAESLQVCHVYGLQSGQLDEYKTNGLKNIVVTRNGKTDWRGTYELRLVVQKGHCQIEEFNRDRR